MMHFIAACFFILAIGSIEGKTFHVNDFGANPNDDLDDRDAIQLTIDHANVHGAGNDIVFGDGIYSISAVIFISNAVNLSIAGQGMDRTFLVGYNQVSIFNAQNCQGLTMTSFAIDYDPLPFTAGYVVHVNDTYLDIQVVSPHRADVDRLVQAILRYDPVQMRPAYGLNTYEIFQTPPADGNTSLVSPGVLRLPLRSPSQFLPRDPVVVRFVFQGDAIYGQDLTDITIRSVTIFTSWGMGFVTLRARRLTVIDYHVYRRDNRWMSTIVDCMHFADSRDYVSIEDSRCESMGDDGLNVHAVYFLVTEVIDSKTIVITATNWTEPLDFSVGTHLEFNAHDLPFTVHASGQVASLEYNTRYSRKLTFTEDIINVSIGDWACVGDTPRLTIRNFTVANNRARGVLLETRHVEVRQSLFNRTSGPAVLIQPSMYWHEGPDARNISLLENVYNENNEGIAQQRGIITILPDPIQIQPVINDIRIESSTFVLGLDSQGLLQCDNTHNLSLTGNYIATNQSTPLISICNSRNITAQNNCVVNQQTKIEEYYIFDTTSPCSMNLSSLIDLSPSGFNASFPPPVIDIK
jgi:hypothetical protein